MSSTFIHSEPCQRIIVEGSTSSTTPNEEKNPVTDVLGPLPTYSTSTPFPHPSRNLFMDGLYSSGDALARVTDSNHAVKPNPTRLFRGTSPGFIESYTLASRDQEEENESSCCECEGGGELICCDTCVKAFHLLCLPPKYRPVEFHDSSVAVQWSCPVCVYFRVHESIEKRRGVFLTMRHGLPVPPIDCDPKLKRGNPNRRPISISNGSVPSEKRLSSEATGRDSSRRCTEEHDISSKTNCEPHHQYLLEHIKKNETVSGKTYLSETPISRITRSAAAAAAALFKKEGAAVSGTTNSPSTLSRMNVGPGFQVPDLPIPFLEVQSLGRSYTHLTNSRDSRSLSCARIVYSSMDWIIKARRLGTSTPFCDLTCQHTEDERQNHSKSYLSIRGFPDEVYSVAESLNQLSREVEREHFVDTQEKLVNFCHLLTSRWSPSCHWPYCSEYAYKLLFYCQFDAKAALEFFEDPNFDFQVICDPPLRPYFNKWKPSDKRSFFPSTPFPPPLHLQALYAPLGNRPRHPVCSVALCSSWTPYTMCAGIVLRFRQLTDLNKPSPV